MARTKIHSRPGVVEDEVETRFCVVRVRDDADTNLSTVDVQVADEIRHEALDVVEVRFVERTRRVEDEDDIRLAAAC